MDRQINRLASSTTFSANLARRESIINSTANRRPVRSIVGSIESSLAATSASASASTNASLVGPAALGHQQGGNDTSGGTSTSHINSPSPFSTSPQTIPTNISQYLIPTILITSPDSDHSHLLSSGDQFSSPTAPILSSRVYRSLSRTSSMSSQTNSSGSRRSDDEQSLNFLDHQIYLNNRPLGRCMDETQGSSSTSPNPPISPTSNLLPSSTPTISSSSGPVSSGGASTFGPTSGAATTPVAMINGRPVFGPPRPPHLMSAPRAPPPASAHQRLESIVEALRAELHNNIADDMAILRDMKSNLTAQIQNPTRVLGPADFEFEEEFMRKNGVAILRGETNTPGLRKLAQPNFPGTLRVVTRDPAAASSSDPILAEMAIASSSRAAPAPAEAEPEEEDDDEDDDDENPFGPMAPEPEVDYSEEKGKGKEKAEDEEAKEEVLPAAVVYGPVRPMSSHEAGHLMEAYQSRRTDTRPVTATTSSLAGPLPLLFAAQPAPRKWRNAHKNLFPGPAALARQAAGEETPGATTPTPRSEPEFVATRHLTSYERYVAAVEGRPVAGTAGIQTLAATKAKAENDRRRRGAATPTASTATTMLSEPSSEALPGLRVHRDPVDVAAA